MSAVPAGFARALVACLAALATLCGAVASTLVGVTPAAAVQAAQSSMVSVVPVATTPDVKDGTVYAFAQVGNTVVVGGSFTTVANHGSSTTLARANLLAFDKVTGLVSTTFLPTVNGEVDTLAAGTGNTVYVGGAFTTVNGSTTRLVRLDVTTGRTVSGWTSPAINGPVSSVVLRGSRLFVGGSFSKVGTTTQVAHAGLLSVDPTSGAVTSYVKSQVAGHHSWVSGNGVKSGAVGVKKLDVNPAGTQLVAIGNFTTVDGVSRDQIARFTLGASAMTLDTGWKTLAFTAKCSKSFDSYVRDVQYSPDGSYFIVTNTGAGGTTPLNTDGTRSKCDAAVRFNSATSGTNVAAAWTSYTGNDSLWATAVTGTAVYVSGHQRWVNNISGTDTPGQGSVPRPGIAALDPLNGLPLSWNPGRNPRGAGAFALLATSDRLYVGSDTDYIGNRKYYHGKLAAFPLAGGAGAQDVSPATLPGTVFRAGGYGNTAPDVLYRLNVGGPALPAGDGSLPWAADTSDLSAVRNTGSTVATASLASVDSTVPTDTPKTLFGTQRYDGGVRGDGKEMHFAFPVPAGTTVTVRLYFLESSMTAGGQRTFDVSVEGSQFLTAFDAYAAAGRQVGTMRSVSVVSDGEVDADFTHILNNPMVSGIEIVRTGLPTAGSTIYRVNSGGPAVPATDAGPAWLADDVTTVGQGTPFRVGGTPTSYPTSVSTYGASVPAGTPNALFENETQGSSFTYRFPVPAGTHVTLRLFFANQAPLTGSAGKRAFAVTVDGAAVLTNYDVVATAGGTQIAVTTEHPVTSDGTLDVAFSSGAVGVPMVDAIEVVAMDASPTVVPDASADALTGVRFTGTAVGAPVPATWGQDWHRVRGAFVVGSTLYYGWTDGYLHQRPLVGTGFGADSVVNPYEDPAWATVVTGSTSGTQYYKGSLPTFYLAEMENVTSMFYSAGRVFYTVAGKPTMYARYFTPDSGTVGSESMTVADGRDWSDVSGAFLAGSTLYYATKTGGVLRSVGWTGAMATGTPVVVDSSTNWAARALFLQPDRIPATVVARAAVSSNGQTATPEVQVPGSVRSGDLLLLFASFAASGVSVTPPAGWVQVDSQSNGTGGLGTVLFTKTATAADADTTATVTLSSKTRASLSLGAYSGALGSVTAGYAGDSGLAAHTTPQVAVGAAGSWVVSYVADKSNGPTKAWTVSSPARVRTTSYGADAGSVGGVLADIGAVGVGTAGGLVVTSDLAGIKGNAWSVVLTPAG